MNSIVSPWRVGSTAASHGPRMLAIATLGLAAMTVLLPQSAHAGFVYTAQGRSLEAGAGAVINEYEDHDLATDTAPDLGPWSRTVSAFASVFEPYDHDFAYGESEAWIDSVLSSHAITASGGATGYGDGSHIYSGGGLAFSTFSVDFTLDLAFDRLATFTMSERANSLDLVEGAVYIRLSGPAFGPYDVNFESHNFGQNRDWERTFLLPAGLHSYQLRVSASGIGSDAERGTGSYEFTFSYVPEPSSVVLAGVAALLAAPLLRRRLNRRSGRG